MAKKVKFCDAFKFTITIPLDIKKKNMSTVYTEHTIYDFNFSIGDLCIYSLQAISIS